MTSFLILFQSYSHISFYIVSQISLISFSYLIHEAKIKIENLAYCLDSRLYMQMQNTQNQYQTELAQYKDEIAHTLDRPSMHIGDVNVTSYDNIPVSISGTQIRFKTVQISQAFHQCFIEIYINSRDQNCRDPQSCKIDVLVNQDEGYIEVTNDGNGLNTGNIECEGEMIPNPQACFFQKRTSTNYNDSEFRTTGGTNGIGAKIVAIMSSKFTIETVFYNNKDKTYSKYVQTAETNTRQINPPVVTQPKSQRTYTKIRYYLELHRFKMQKITDLDVQIMRAYVIISGQTNNLFKLGTKQSFTVIKEQKEQKSYFGQPDQTLEIIYKHFIRTKIEEEQTQCWSIISQGWECNVMFPCEQATNLSITNGIINPKLGTGIDFYRTQIQTAIKAKYNSDPSVDSKVMSSITRQINSELKNKMGFLVSCCINQPVFESQIKHELKTVEAQMNPRPKIDPEIITKIVNSKAIKEMVQKIKRNQDKESLHENKVKNFRALRDAKYFPAKSKLAKDNFLFICEGDSAKNFISSMINGDNQNYGMLILQGKPMNFRKNSYKRATENKEFQLIKDALGLNNTSSVQIPTYQNIVIAADFDDDGIHICGLILNMFHQFWPDLLTKIYVKQLKTAVVRTQGKQFFTFQDFKNYYNQLEVKERPKTDKIYYSKGLGSNDDVYAFQVRSNLSSHIIDFKVIDEKKTEEMMELVFGQKCANQRKKWILEYDSSYSLNYNNKYLMIGEYLDKGVVQYSVANVIRSIPSICDSFKETTRKIFYTAMLKIAKNKKQVKVSQFGGLVGETVGYHHGEASLNQAISKMSNGLFNKLNVLEGIGQFGNLLDNRASAPRYVSTQYNQLMNKIFEHDFIQVLDKNEEEQFENQDSKKQMPKHLIPLIPMVLINGCQGIATGFSTYIAQYNVQQIVQCIQDLLYNDLIEDQNQQKPRQVNFDFTPEFADFYGKYRSVDYDFELTEKTQGDQENQEEQKQEDQQENQSQNTYKEIEKSGYVMENNENDLDIDDDSVEEFVTKTYLATKIFKKAWTCTPQLQLDINQNKIRLQSYKPLQTHIEFVQMINRKFNTPKKDKKEEEEKKTIKKKEVQMKNLVVIEGMPGNIKTDIVLNVDRSVLDFQKELEEINKNSPDYEGHPKSSYEGHPKSSYEGHPKSSYEGHPKSSYEGHSKALIKLEDMINEKFGFTEHISQSNMYLLDRNGQIKKYNNLQEIVIEYYETVLDYQQRKKKYKIKKINMELELLKYKIIFIKGYIADKIVFKNRKSAQICQDFEQILQIPDKGVYNDSIHDILLKMQVKDFTEELIIKHQAQIDDLLKEKEFWKTVKPQKLWLDALESFKNEVVNFKPCWVQEKEKISVKKQKK